MVEYFTETPSVRLFHNPCQENIIGNHYNLNFVLSMVV